MTKDEALKLALEAFEAIPEEIEGWIPDKCTNAVIAIKEALAQPEYQSTADKSKLEKVPAKGTLLAQPEQERPQNCGTGYCSCIECVMEPEQEPDFYMTKQMANQIKDAKTNWAICVNVNKFPTEKKTVPVFIGYTTPPQRTWVGLTDEEMLAIVHYSQLDNVKAIEAKLKQKNGHAEEKNT